MSLATVDTRKYKCYNNDMVFYTQATAVYAYCAEILFYNLGTSTVVLNNIPLLPGQGIGFDGEEGELDVTKYFIKFTGAGDNGCFVIRKCYVEG